MRAYRWGRVAPPGAEKLLGVRLDGERLDGEDLALEVAKQELASQLLSYDWTWVKT